jgi:hypothetical protein
MLYATAVAIPNPYRVTISASHQQAILGGEDKGLQPLRMTLPDGKQMTAR